GELVLARDTLGLELAAGLARLPAPRAIASDAGELLRRDTNCNRVRIRQNVVFLRRTPGIPALAGCGVAARTSIAVVTGFADRLRRPAEPALLIAFAGGRRAFIRMRGVFAVGIVEATLRAPDDIVGRRACWIA